MSVISSKKLMIPYHAFFTCCLVIQSLNGILLLSVQEERQISPSCKKTPIILVLNEPSNLWDCSLSFSPESVLCSRFYDSWGKARLNLLNLIPVPSTAWHQLVLNFCLLKGWMCWFELSSYGMWEYFWLHRDMYSVLSRVTLNPGS